MDICGQCNCCMLSERADLMTEIATLKRTLHNDSHRLGVRNNDVRYAVERMRVQEVEPLLNSLDAAVQENHKLKDENRALRGAVTAVTNIIKVAGEL